MAEKTKGRDALTTIAPDPDATALPLGIIPDPSIIQRTRIERLAVACAAQYANELTGPPTGPGVAPDLTEILADGSPRWQEGYDGGHYDTLWDAARRSLRAAVRKVYGYSDGYASLWLREFRRAANYSDDALEALVRGSLGGLYVVVLDDAAQGDMESQLVRAAAYDAERIRRKLNGRSA